MKTRGEIVKVVLCSVARHLSPIMLAKTPGGKLGCCPKVGEDMHKMVSHVVDSVQTVARQTQAKIINRDE